MQQENHYPVVVISDVHLGMRNGACDLLCEFLRHTPCDRLVLNGDIIDGWRMDRRKPRALPEAQMRVLDAINRKLAEGTEVIYIPGNHDVKLRHLGLFGKNVMGIRFEKEMDFTDPKGRRLLIAHGDLLGPMPGIARGIPEWLSHVIYDYSYVAMTRVSAAIDKLGHLALRRHFGLVSCTRRLIETFNGDKRDREELAIAYARDKGYDGIVCGHFHAEARRVEADGILYLNSGDWVENFTALTMDRAGEWQVMKWGHARHALKLKRAFFSAAEDHSDKAFRSASEQMLEAIRQIWPGRVSAKNRTKRL